MFIRVVRAPVSDRNAIEKQWNAWHDELAPAAGGWLGSTAGITDDGEFLAAVHFEYEALARIQDRRAGQQEWWDQFTQWMDEPPDVYDCTESDMLLVGGEDAGFVQFITGYAPDPERMRAVNLGMEDLLLKHRPDIVGSEIAWHDDGGYTKIAYFLTESSARSWESREFPGGLRAMYDELMGLIENLEFLDLSDPWITTP